MRALFASQIRVGRHSNWRGKILPLVSLILLALSVPESSSWGQERRGQVYVLTIDGVINPLTARYLTRNLDRSAEADAALVLLELNTPGGLETSMREMVEKILASPVPVAVYVTPPGGRAASAGMFITMAGHVAAMAPGTNIGAAHPVGLGAQPDEVRQEKVVQDAAALARSIAATRGRNAAWAEQAVLESVSITAGEALDEGVIDLVAGTRDELLRRIDGRRIVTAATEVTLETTGASVVEQPMNLAERILHTLTDPNIAYLLFSLGMIGLIAELYSPGLLFPGITGAISLIIAFVAFGSLPLNWAALALLVLAAGLVVAELFSEGIGILGAGGVIAFVLGSLMLYTPFSPASPAMPDVEVSPWLIALMTAAMVAFIAFVVGALLRSRRLPVVTGIQALIGRDGTAVSDLAPEGTVRIDSEQWHAVAEADGIRAGDPVQIVGVRGVTLQVIKAGPVADARSTVRRAG